MPVTRGVFNRNFKFYVDVDFSFSFNPIIIRINSIMVLKITNNSNSNNNHSNIHMVVPYIKGLSKSFKKICGTVGSKSILRE